MTKSVGIVVLHLEKKQFFIKRRWYPKQCTQHVQECSIPDFFSITKSYQVSLIDYNAMKLADPGHLLIGKKTIFLQPVPATRKPVIFVFHIRDAKSMSA